MKAALSFPGCHRRAGVERIVFECARYLAAHGHDVQVFANDWEEDPTCKMTYHYVPVRKRPAFLRGASYYRNCARELTGSAFDVLNTHGCVCPPGGVHWVQSVHRAWLGRSRMMRSPFSSSRIKQRLNPLHPVLLRLEAHHFRDRTYRKVIATTEEVKSDLKRLYGVPDNDVIVVPNGFSPTEFSPERRAEQRSEMRAKLGLRPENVALLFVANELERKGYMTILSAMKELANPDIRLLVVGKPSTALVKAIAARGGLSDQVIACGSTTDVAAYHAAADLFVLPTQYEAFCLAILEAMGSGLPVITTTVPGARDAIQPGVNGSLISDPNSGIQLADALRPLLCRDTLDTYSARTPGTVVGYQWPNVLAQYEKILLECANRQ